MVPDAISKLISVIKNTHYHKLLSYITYSIMVQGNTKNVKYMHALWHVLLILHMNRVMTCWFHRYCWFHYSMGLIGWMRSMGSTGSVGSAASTPHVLTSTTATSYFNFPRLQNHLFESCSRPIGAGFTLHVDD